MEEFQNRKPEREDSSGTVALTVGILSIVLAVIGLSPVALALGIVGIVQGNKSKSHDREGLSGFICGIIGVVLSLSSLVLLLLFAFSFTSLTSLLFRSLLLF